MVKIKQLKIVRNTLLNWEISIVLFLLIFLLVVVVTEVIFRYLDFPLYWSEEIARYTFIWMVMFGCIIGVEKKIHFQVDIIVRSANKKIQRFIFFLSNFVASLFLIFMFYEGISLCIKTKKVTSAALGIPQFYAYLAVPVAALLMLIHLLFQVYEKMFLERNSD